MIVAEIVGKKIWIIQEALATSLKTSKYHVVTKLVTNNKFSNDYVFDFVSIRIISN